MTFRSPTATPTWRRPRAAIPQRHLIARFLQEQEKCGNMQRAQRSIVSILLDLVGFYSSRILAGKLQKHLNIC